ncbi:pyruvate dehydrogenase E1 component beta subunit [Blastomonas natatoria]|uniref:Pyruvate dehydrogenase E1 component beta subunit n=1 Tax=Blastomonas natatoria TaxID=34015 RepID=A0A2V3VAS0_9SPHN|nr:alpha-ketoacid dehydrogenase subunit beta [Blastomonas natatoria]PXW73829.1 pyruvate dehydrogenase E1 component beta subunit [Blastomonas natatoria]
MSEAETLEAVAPRAKKPKQITMVQALNAAIDEAMAADEGVILLGEDVGAKQGGGVFKVSSGLTEKYGEHRIRATPISEQAIMGACVGAALTGMRPIAEIMLMNFVTVAMDQIVNHAAKLRFMSGGQTNVPMVIRTTTGVGVGFGGQHSDMLEAWFAHVPGLKIVTPSNAADARGLMRSAIECNDPVIFIENILCYGLKSDDPGTDYRVPLGQAAIAREGSDVSLITYGRTVLDALEVAETLAAESVSVEVIDLRTIAPFDEATVTASVRKTGRAVVLHEAVRAYGTGAEIASRLHESLFNELKAPVQRIGGAFSAVPMASVLEQAWIPKKEEIAAAIRTTMDWKR